LSTLAIDGSKGVGTAERGSLLRHIDLLLLAAGLPVFLLAGLPILGYGVLAAAWLAQAAIEFGAERLAARSLSDRNRKAAMGWIAAATLGRVWLVALAILMVGLVEREAGLAAAIFAGILVTTHLIARFATRSGEIRGSA
jgi:hypothetical protein